MTIPTYYNVGQTLYASGIVGMEELNGRELTILSTNLATTPAVLTFAVSPSEDDYSGTTNIDSTTFGTYSSAGTLAPVLETAHSYAEADLATLQFAQSDDVIYIVHPSYAPQKLVRNTDQLWDWITVGFIDGPFLDAVGGSSVGTLTYASGAGTITASVSGTFATTDVGRQLRVFDTTTSKWVWTTISSYSSSTVVHVAAFSAAGLHDSTGLTDGNVASTSQWRFGVWSTTTGFPSTVVFYQDRLVFGGPTLNPSRFDGSNASDYENFSPTDSAGSVTAAKAYSFILASQDFNQIQWMTSDERGLLMGTTNAEWVVKGADSQSALSALSVSAERTTSVGGQNVQALQLGKSTIFVQRGATQLRELSPNAYTANGFTAPDLTEYADHITKTGVTQMAVMKMPQPIVWMVRTDGTLVSMTYERTTESIKVGFARHPIGGTLSDGSTSVVESIAVIPSSTQDQLYMVVKRYVNGHTLRYIEYLTPFFQTYSVLTDAIFSDSSLTYSGTATRTISGLNHLNGQLLTVLADGGVATSATPVNGRITLSAAASIVTIGLPIIAKGQKLRSDAGASDGTGMGKTRRIHRVGFHLLNTLGFKLGPDFSSLDDLFLDDTEAGILGSAPSLFTGIMSHPISNDYDFDNMFCWQQDQPLPGTIVGIFPLMVTQDRG